MKLLALFPLISSLCLAGAFSWKSTKEEFQPTPTDEAITAYFTFTNTATEPIKIISAKSSCESCTDLTWEDKEYGPGESGELIATVKTAGLNGRISRMITVLTSDKPKFPDRLELVIHTEEKLTIPKEPLRWERQDSSPREIPLRTTIPNAKPYVKQVQPEGLFVVELQPGNDAASPHRLMLTPTGEIKAPKRATITIGVKSETGVEYTQSLTASRR